MDKIAVISDVHGNIPLHGRVYLVVREGAPGVRELEGVQGGN